MKTFNENQLKENSRLVVLFKAPWCGPCNNATPILEEISNETSPIFVVNTDDDRPTAVKYGIKTIPVLKVFENGEVVQTITNVGSKTKSELLSELSA